MDHHYLNFWLWACLHDAEAYLAASEGHRSIIEELGASALAHKLMPDMRTHHERRTAAQQRMELEKYHFVTSMGSLLRNLRRSQHLFPTIQLAYNKAQHLLTEGKQLRDMVEHAEEYLEGKGRKQDVFVREAEGIATSLPGTSPGIADVTSTVIDENGHWIGGRLNVERAIAEVRLIAEEAKKIPAPSTMPRPPNFPSSPIC
jgi:hypothetical protein